MRESPRGQQPESSSSGDTAHPVYEHQSTYDSKSQLTSDIVTSVRSDGTWVTTTTYDYKAESTPGSGVYTGVYEGGVVTHMRSATNKIVNGTSTAQPTTDTRTTYSWQDDSDGHAGALIARAAEIHLMACQAARPDPVALAQSLFARETESEWDFFHRASEIYATILGKAGLAEYRRLADEAWKKIKSLTGARHIGEDRYGLRFRLASMLDRFAERDGNLDARIAIRAKDLSIAYDYFGIADLCLAHGRDAEALKWAEEGLRSFRRIPIAG